MTGGPTDPERPTAVRRAARAFAASWREAFRDDGSLTLTERRAIGGLAGVAAVLFFTMSWQRYATFHDPNFDLAFYARLAWGDVHQDGWEPLLDAHVYGLHFVWVLEVLGVVGLVLGQVRTLLVAQSLAVAAAAWPLARVASRALRDGSDAPGLARLAPFAGALAWLLHPNLWHVATRDFHPGTLAVLPLAWACDALHRRSAHGVLWSSLGVLACREDLGLVVVLFGLALALARRRELRARRVGLGVAGGALAYVALFLGYFHPRYAPAQGSFSLHFARWAEGSSWGGPFGAILAVLSHPLDVVAWLAAPERAPYLLVITAPLAFLAFLAPEWMLLALPVLAMNLLSSFPTTLLLDSHYLTPALPMLVAASAVGAGRVALLSARAGLPLAPAAATPSLVVSAVLAHVMTGGSPIGRHFDARAYAPDATTDAIEAALAQVPPGASVQAPERVLAHLAERRVLRRGPPPEANTDFVLLDAWRRRADAHREELLRTEEEPLVRDWLAREDHALVSAGEGIYLLERGAPPERDVGRRHVVGTARADEGRALTACLALLDARLEEGRAEVGRGEGTLVLTLAARGPCASDLALRIGWGYRPRRVDLLADGELSPARLRAGDRLESRHVLDVDELRDVQQHGLRVGAIRQSGARPDHGDPVALDVPLGGTVHRR